MILSTWLLAATTLVPSANPEPLPVERTEYWHHWRGPNADGVALHADPPIRWKQDSNIKWKAELPGRGSASPIVWGDRVFVLTAVDTGREADPANLPKLDPKFQKKTTAPTNYYQFLVLCFDRNTGALLWKQTAAERVPHEGCHPTHSYAAGSPTTDGKRLYASFGSFGTYCYDFAGNLLWSRDLGLLNTRLGWGEAVTPVVYGDALLLNWDQEENSKLIRLDAATGQTRWQVDRDERTSWNTPLVVRSNGNAQVVLNGTKRIRSYDFETGSLLWECGGMTTNAIPSPVTDGNLLYCMSGYQGTAAVAIRLDARGDVSQSAAVLWRYAKGTPYVPSPLLVGGKLYFTQANNALLTSLDAANGKPILDRVRLPQLSSFYASPIAAAGRIYLVDRTGTTLVFKEGDKFEPLAINKLEDAFDATPAAAGKQLFLRGASRLYCIEEK
jgi:outer membrane protein assembly factor BamB